MVFFGVLGTEQTFFTPEEAIGRVLIPPHIPCQGNKGTFMMNDARIFRACTHRFQDDALQHARERWPARRRRLILAF